MCRDIVGAINECFFEFRDRENPSVNGTLRSRSKNMTVIDAIEEVFFAKEHLVVVGIIIVLFSTQDQRLRAQPAEMRGNFKEFAPDSFLK